MKKKPKNSGKGVGHYGVTKYQKIKEINFVKKEDGDWVKVTFENGTEWLPALIDLGKILNGIGKCEDKKYPHGEGRHFAKPFYEQCIETKNPDDIEDIYHDHYNPNKK